MDTAIAGDVQLGRVVADVNRFDGVRQLVALVPSIQLLHHATKKKNEKKKRLIGRWCSKRNVSRRNGYLGARVVAHTGRPPERIRERQLHVEQFVFVQVQSKP